MKRDFRACIARVGGTNCDAETKRALEDLGIRADILHFRRLNGDCLEEYDILVFPGGFAYGDYVRAGAIWGKEIMARLGRSLKAFIDGGKVVLGICNGFQVLVEAGLLPGIEGWSLEPRAALATNTSASYECRWIYVKHTGKGRSIFTSKIAGGEVLRLPVAHGEGRFLLPEGEEERYIGEMEERGQIIFRYCDRDGEYAGGRYPINPNGALYDIAAISNPEGNILGMMPHPERAYYGWQIPEWTRRGRPETYGDGRKIFESLLHSLLEEF